VAGEECTENSRKELVWVRRAKRFSMLDEKVRNKQEEKEWKQLRDKLVNIAS
jgi:hypothetical protein